MADLVDVIDLKDAWGLHDAVLRRLDWDWVKRTVRLDVTIMLGERQERCREGTVEITDVAFVVVEPPTSALRDPGDEWDISAHRLDAETGGVTPTLPEAPGGHWINIVYSRQANTCLYICAADASYEWTGEEREGTGGVLLPGDEIPDPPSSSTDP